MYSCRSAITHGILHSVTICHRRPYIYMLMSTYQLVHTQSISSALLSWKIARFNGQSYTFFKWLQGFASLLWQMPLCGKMLDLLHILCTCSSITSNFIKRGFKFMRNDTCSFWIQNTFHILRKDLVHTVSPC